MSDTCEWPGCNEPGLKIAAPFDPTIAGIEPLAATKPSFASAVTCDSHRTLMERRLNERHAPGLVARREGRPR